MNCAKVRLVQLEAQCTVESLNVDTLKSGHLFYSGHFVLSQRNKKVYYFTPDLSNQDTFYRSQRCPHLEIPL